MMNVDRKKIPKHLRYLSNQKLLLLIKLFKGRFLWIN